MSANLPTMPLTTAAALVMTSAAAGAITGGAPELNRLADSVTAAGSAAERADLHVQMWRTGMAKMTLEVALRDDPALDAAFALIRKTEAWKILQAACMESPRIMNELRAYWKPGDKVEIRD